jgi:ribosomal protein S18 acetylase RimI-like enzyme
VTYRVRGATTADEGWLEQLRRKAYAELFDPTWGGWDEARHARQFSASLERGGISIIEVGGEPVGMLQLFDDGDALEIGEIQVLPDHQNRRVGTSVLRDLMSRARAEGRDVCLRVGLQNHKAIRLYERLGFVGVERSDTHLHMRYQAQVK